VPYNLVHELVEIRSTPTTVEILHKGTRVASHLRSRGRGQAVTNEEHRPKSHRAHLEWTPSRMVHWAETIGPQHGAAVRADHERQAASGDGLSRLPGHHPAGGKVLAAARGSGLRTCVAHRRLPLQKRRIDLEELARSGASIFTAARFHQPPHDNIRGAEYFE
jgi:hypothetical protein